MLQEQLSDAVERAQVYRDHGADAILCHSKIKDAGQAISAGRLLKKNKVEFDVVYTSWLSRAIETVAVVVAAAVVTMAIVLMMACCCAVHVTRACCCGAQAWIVLSELDDTWLPIHKSWRLNERMYGALTGLSKKKTRAQVQPNS